MNAAIDAPALIPLVRHQSLALHDFERRLDKMRKVNPKGAAAPDRQVRPLMQGQRQLEAACNRLHRLHSSPLAAAEVAGKFSRQFGIINRFRFETGTVAENMTRMGRPAKNDTTFKLFEQKYGQIATELGFNEDKATEFHVGSFDKDARLPNGDLCEIYTFEIDLRKEDYTAVSESDQRLIEEARLFLVLNGNNPVFIGEAGDFIRDVAVKGTLLQARRPVQWSRPIAVVRHDDNVALHVVFPNAAADIKDKIIGRVRSVGPYYTEYGGLVG